MPSAVVPKIILNLKSPLSFSFFLSPGPNAPSPVPVVSSIRPVRLCARRRLAASPVRRIFRRSAAATSKCASPPWIASGATGAHGAPAVELAVGDKRSGTEASKPPPETAASCAKLSAKRRLPLAEWRPAKRSAEMDSGPPGASGACARRLVGLGGSVI